MARQSEERLYTPVPEKDALMTPANPPWQENSRPPTIPRDRNNLEKVNQMIEDNPALRFFRNTGEFLEDTMHSISRSGGTASLTITESLGGPSVLDKGEGGRFQRGFHQAIFGDKDVESLSVRSAKLPERVKEDFGIDAPWVGKYAPFLIAGSVIMDLTGMGGGKKKILSKGTEQAFKFFSKSDDVVKISSKLLSLSDDAVKDAKKLSLVFPRLTKTGANDLALKLKGASNFNSVYKTVDDYIKNNGQNKAIIKKLTDAIRKTKPIRKESEELYSAARAERVASASVEMTKHSGEARFIAGKAKLAGELPKPKFTPVKFLQEDFDALSDTIYNARHLDVFDQFNALTGLQKILGKGGGAIPTESELKLLTDVFGRELADTVLKNRHWLDKLGGLALEAIHTPKTIMSSVDMSAPFRQGIIALTAHPKQSWKNIPAMFRWWKKSDAFLESMNAIKRRPTYHIMKRSRLALTESFETAITATGKEEAFMSNLAERIPGLGRVIRSSERAYVGFLNKTRADVFDDLARRLIDKGYDPSKAKNFKIFDDLAKYVNNATGRGNLEIPLKAAASGNSKWMNALFFSPKLLASRFNMMLNPYFYAKLHPEVRKTAMKSMMKFYAAGSTTVGLAYLAGADVETDPRSSDFMKIKIGNTRLDPWGGFQQYLRLIAQLQQAETKSATSGKISQLRGKGHGERSRFDLILDFGKNKFAPVPSFFVEMLENQNKQDFGEDFDLSTAIVSRMMPLYIQDMLDAAAEEGILAAGIKVGLPAWFGVGAQTFEDKRGKSKGSGIDWQ